MEDRIVTCLGMMLKEKLSWRFGLDMDQVQSVFERVLEVTRVGCGRSSLNDPKTNTLLEIVIVNSWPRSVLGSDGCDGTCGSY